jgi:hypothetical protein
MAPYLLTLANRNYPICVASLKVAKASTVADCRVSLSPTVLLTNVANVNYPLATISVLALAPPKRLSIFCGLCLCHVAKLTHSDCS